MFTTASMFTTGMTFVVMVVVVVALGIRVIGKCSREIGSNRIICTAADTAKQLDT